MALLETMIYYENARCEVTAWGMNPAAIFATALFIPYGSCAEHALCIHKLILKKNTDNIHNMNKHFLHLLPNLFTVFSSIHTVQLPCT
jgi:hypothetical protein